MANQKKLELEDNEPEKIINTRKRKDKNFIGNLRNQTLQGVIAILCFLVTIFLILSAYDKAGVAGSYVYKTLHRLSGVGYYLFPLVTVVLGISYLRNLYQKFDWLKFIGAILFLISSLGIIDIISPSNAGFIGAWTAYPMSVFGDASIVLLSGFVIISILITLNTELDLRKLAFWKKQCKNRKDLDEEENAYVEAAVEEIEESPEQKKKIDKEEYEKAEKLKLALNQQKEEDSFIKPKKWISTEYEAPSLSLLELDHGKPGVGDVKANANIIKRTLANFGIDVEMDEVSIGPSVTRYALKPAEGVKLARIVGLQNDLSLALAAHPIRIEAPIPGKSLVGIEIPNVTKTTVGLGTMLGSEEFKNSDKPLLVSLGKGISGKAHFSNLGKMPHVLIAGSTGSGKSVTIHALIVSLLYRNSPNDLKFIMIDPKRVELTLYNKIPHLLTPVITDAKKAILALKWAAKEMDRRYDILQAEEVRDIDSYHKNVVAKEKAKQTNKDGKTEATVDPMPFIVVILDELADIMSTYPRELEAGIVRLAQMSRAVGIHLMLSTQRPSVNVITGLIKANIPARIALQVASQVDSRTILDMGGAEKLLGAGDMLFMSGEMSKPQRIQSAYISEGEVKRVVKHLVDTHAEELEDQINLTDNAVADKNSIFEASFDNENNMDGIDEDELYEQARQIVMEAGKASTSYIQRKLRVGYARAARIMDILEERGVIGPADGAKPRMVVGMENTTPKEETTTETQNNEPTI